MKDINNGSFLSNENRDYFNFALFCNFLNFKKKVKARVRAVSEVSDKNFSQIFPIPGRIFVLSS